MEQIKLNIGILTFLCLLSCNNEGFVKKKYKTGELKSKIQINNKNIPNGIYEEYYESGELKLKTICNNGIISDSIYEFHKNGNLKSKGIIPGKQYLGWKNIYDSLGTLKRKEEYYVENGKSKLNQLIILKEGKVIDTIKSSFFKVHIRDTIQLGVNYGSIDFFPNKKGELNYLNIAIKNRYSTSKIQIDTFKNKLTEKILFGIYGDKLGKKRVKISLIHHFFNFNEKVISNTTEVDEFKHIKYYEKDVFVVDTIRE